MKVREILESVHPDKTEVQIEHELAALKKAGPHPQGSDGHLKMKELEAALLAKKKAGPVADEEDCAMSMPMTTTEAKEWKVKHTGRNTNKSVAELEKERTKAKKRHDTKAVKQKNFAIRAKTGWGKAK